MEDTLRKVFFEAAPLPLRRHFGDFPSYGPFRLQVTPKKAQLHARLIVSIAPDRIYWTISKCTADSGFYRNANICNSMSIAYCSNQSLRRDYLASSSFLEACVMHLLTVSPSSKVLFFRPTMALRRHELLQTCLQSIKADARSKNFTKESLNSRCRRKRLPRAKRIRFRPMWCGSALC